MFSSDRVVVKLTKAVQESVAWKKELIKEAKPMKSAKIGSISFCFRQEDVYTVTPTTAIRKFVTRKLAVRFDLNHRIDLAFECFIVITFS